ncbi:unnamed protein product, partial [marine sediment metagenome]
VIPYAKEGFNLTFDIDKYEKATGHEFLEKGETPPTPPPVTKGKPEPKAPPAPPEKPPEPEFKFEVPEGKFPKPGTDEEWIFWMLNTDSDAYVEKMTPPVYDSMAKFVTKGTGKSLKELTGTGAPAWQTLYDTVAEHVGTMFKEGAPLVPPAPVKTGLPPGMFPKPESDDEIIELMLMMNKDEFVAKMKSGDIEKSTYNSLKEFVERQRGRKLSQIIRTPKPSTEKLYDLAKKEVNLILAKQRPPPKEPEVPLEEQLLAGYKKLSKKKMIDAYVSSETGKTKLEPSKKVALKNALIDKGYLDEANAKGEFRP